MKIFIDSANIDEIKEAISLGVISGCTTNPTLMAGTNKSMYEVMNEIFHIVQGPISIEVKEDTCDNMYKEAIEIAEILKYPDNLVIKIPLTREGIKLCKKLYEKNIKTNVTLIFDEEQALLAMEANATYISPFMGRLDKGDPSIRLGFNALKRIVEIRNKYNYSTLIIAASIRSDDYVKQALEAGSDIATIPFKVLMSLYDHPLTESGLKTFNDAKVIK